MQNSGPALSTLATQQAAYVLQFNDDNRAPQIASAVPDGLAGQACAHEQEPMASHPPEAGSSESEKYHLDAPLAAQEISTDASTALGGVTMDTTQAGQPMLLLQSEPAVWCTVPQVQQQQAQQQHVMSPHAASGMVTAYTIPNTSLVAQPWQGQQNTFTFAVPQQGLADATDGASGYIPHTDTSAGAGDHAAAASPTLTPHHGPPTSELPLYHRFWSKKQSQVLLSPARLLHIPRNLIEESLDLDAILAAGLNIQIETDGVVQPETISTTIALYKNSTGHSYYRLLGFKQVCRKYQDWALQCWAPVDNITVRMCIKWPHPDVAPVIRDDVPLPTMRAAKRGSTRKRLAPTDCPQSNASNVSDSSSGQARAVKLKQHAPASAMQDGSASRREALDGFRPLREVTTAQSVGGDYNTTINGIHVGTHAGAVAAGNAAAAPSISNAMQPAGMCMAGQDSRQYIMQVPGKAPAVPKRGDGTQLVQGGMNGNTGGVPVQQWANTKPNVSNNGTQLVSRPQQPGSSDGVMTMQCMPLSQQISMLQTQSATGNTAAGYQVAMLPTQHQQQIQINGQPTQSASGTNGMIHGVTSVAPSCGMSADVAYMLQAPSGQQSAVPPQQQFALVQTPTGLVVVPIMSADTAAPSAVPNNAMWSQLQGMGNTQAQPGTWNTQQLVQMPAQGHVVMQAQPQQLMVLQQGSPQAPQQQQYGAGYTLIQSDTAGIYDQAQMLGMGGFMNATQLLCQQPQQHNMGPLTQSLLVQQQQQQPQQHGNATSVGAATA